MSLTRTIDQMVAATRQIANVEGQTGLLRHPDANVFDYVNRGIAALDRVLRTLDSGQRYLTSTTITTAASTETYSLPADFMHLISLGGSVNGVQRWFKSYDMSERPHLIDTNAGWTGEPLYYRLRASNISLLPIPAAVYSLTLWYQANPSTLTTGQSFDTIARLDDFIVYYAARFIAKKDKNFDLHVTLTDDMNALRGEIETIARGRDQNSPARIVDVSERDRQMSRYR